MSCRTMGVCGVLGVVLSAGACGDHKNLGVDALDPSQGGGAGKSVAPVGGHDDADAAGAPTAAGTQQSEGGASATEKGGTNGGDSDSAGSGSVDPRYDFLLLPDVAPANPFDGGTTTAQVESWGQSADGRLVFGVCSWRLFSPDGAPPLGGQVPFRWSPGTGSVAMPELNEEQPAIAVAAQGGSAFLSGKDASGNPIMLRWTASGAHPLKTAGQPFDQFYPTTISPDGRVAFVSAQRGDVTTTLVWRESEGSDQLVETALPAPAFSADGTVAYFQVYPAVNTTQLLRWVVAAGPITPVEIEQPAGYHDCALGAGYGTDQLQPISADGSVIAGTCGARAKDAPVMFRWQLGDPAMSVITEGPALPELSSADGTQIIGKGKYGDHVSGDNETASLTWWAADGAVQLPILGTIHGMSRDHSTVWLENADVQPGQGASRWTRSGGLQQLPTAEGSLFAQITAVSDDGTLAVGFSQVSDDQFNSLHMLLWDVDGNVRDVTLELRQAGIQLKGTATQPINERQLAPTRVWPGDPIRIGGNAGGSFQRATWFATLPQQR